MLLDWTFLCLHWRTRLCWWISSAGWMRPGGSETVGQWWLQVGHTGVSIRVYCPILTSLLLWSPNDHYQRPVWLSSDMHFVQFAPEKLQTALNSVSMNIALHHACVPIWTDGLEGLSPGDILTWVITILKQTNILDAGIHRLLSKQKYLVTETTNQKWCWYLLIWSWNSDDVL